MRLFINTLAFLLAFGGVFAQECNEARYHRLLLQQLEKPGVTFSRISGYDEEFLKSRLKLDSTAAKSLLVQEPDIRFTRLEGGHYLRTIDLTFQHLVSDSIIAEFAEFARDTLDAKGFKAVRKGADAVLRGNDPRFWSNFLLPATLVISGITGIISLFYIRSS